MPFPLVVQLLVSGVCYLLDPEGGLDSLKKKNNNNNKKRKRGQYHTMPKYLLRLRKTSFLLMFRNSAMSLGSNKASSKDEATRHPIPPLKLLIDASSLRGLPLSMGAGSQVSASGG